MPINIRDIADKIERACPNADAIEQYFGPSTVEALQTMRREDLLTTLTILQIPTSVLPAETLDAVGARV